MKFKQKNYLNRKKCDNFPRQKRIKQPNKDQYKGNQSQEYHSQTIKMNNNEKLKDTLKNLKIH